MIHFSLSRHGLDPDCNWANPGDRSEPRYQTTPELFFRDQPKWELAARALAEEGWGLNAMNRIGSARKRVRHLGERAERWIERVKKHPWVVVLIFLVALVAGASKFIGGIRDLRQFAIQVADRFHKYQVDRIVSVAKKGVVGVEYFDSNGPESHSGFLVGDNLVLTLSIDGGRGTSVEFYNGTPNSAYLYSPLADFRLLKVARITGEEAHGPDDPLHFPESSPPRDIKSLAIAKSTPQSGQRILIVGLASGAHQISSVEATVTGTFGDNRFAFHADKDLPPGFEGAPCIDLSGHVLGLYRGESQASGTKAGDEQAELINQGEIVSIERTGAVLEELRNHR